MTSAERFLAATPTYDILLLGWNADYFTGGHIDRWGNWTTVNRTTFDCVFNVHIWFETHAYIVSHSRMSAWKNLTYDGVGGVPIDDYLSSLDRNLTYVVKPKAIFQGLHSSQATSQDRQALQTDGPLEVVAETPAIWYQFVEPLVFSNVFERVQDENTMPDLRSLPDACYAPPEALQGTPLLPAHFVNVSRAQTRRHQATPVGDSTVPL